MIFVLALFGIASVVQPSPWQPSQAVDCLGLIRNSNYPAIVDHFTAMSRDARRQCLDQLSRPLTDSSALALSELANRRLIDDPALIPLLMDCQSRNLNMLGRYCNRVLWYLTGHPYGEVFFEQSMGAPPFTAENHALATADWRAYDNLLARDHWIFDVGLENECVNAVRAIRSRLVETLSARVPNHVLIPYLKTALEGRGRILESEGERLFFFGLGESNLGPGFAEPANWFRSGELQGIRILMLRPGISQPVSPMQTDSQIRAFPASTADYDEVFKTLDVEIRFQIVTSNDALRRSAIEAVKEALSGLRERNGKL